MRPKSGLESTLHHALESTTIILVVIATAIVITTSLNLVQNISVVLFTVSGQERHKLSGGNWAVNPIATSRSQISKISLCLVLPHFITIRDGKADCAKIFTVFKVQVHH